MKALSAVLPSAEFSVVVMSGPEKGTVYRLMGQSVSIGRGAENDIVLPHDLKCSRKHATIRLTNEGYVIEDVSGKNKLWVNGREVSISPLQASTSFMIGDTELRFDIGGAKPAPHLQVATPGYSSSPAFERPRRQRKPQNNAGMGRLVLYGGVGVFLWFVFSSPAKKTDDPGLRNDQQIEAEIEVAKKLQEEAEKKKLGTNNLPFEEAQGSYVRGFRDYKKGQFGSAMESFQACLSLYPEHVLCNRYLRLSQRRFNELIQYHMILGRKYREQNQFSACAAAFRNVMMMVRDTNSTAYKEAKANFDACHAFVEERF